jgi:hypothetical protein
MAMKRDAHRPIPTPGSRPAQSGATTLDPSHSPEGVDLTLIRWMISLTPLERLEVLQATLRSIGRLRGEAAED